MAADNEADLELHAGGSDYINKILVPTDMEKYQNFLCSCGNTRKMKGKNLERSLSTQCDCTEYLPFTPETEDMIDNILVRRYTRKWGKAYTVRSQYHAIHNRCGKAVKIKGDKMPRCFKCHTGSRGEVKVGQILDGCGIQYVKEYSFSDLRDFGPLRFDFAMVNEDGTGMCLLEYQGEQHFFYVPRVSGTKAKYEEGLKRDRMKRAYCSKNHIPLLEVPYYWTDIQIHQEIRRLIQWTRRRK